jgi:hypothetical protein
VAKLGSFGLRSGGFSSLMLYLFILLPLCVLQNGCIYGILIHYDAWREWNRLEALQASVARERFLP